MVWSSEPNYALRRTSSKRHQQSIIPKNNRITKEVPKINLKGFKKF